MRNHTKAGFKGGPSGKTGTVRASPLIKKMGQSGRTTIAKGSE